ncbi:MAG: AraC family transcriptional regulator [Pyrinomonadaceae bacterium]
MSEPTDRSKNLKAGEFYGKVSQKRELSFSTISELIHRSEVDLPAHSHELSYFTLLLDGSYSETYGRKSFTYRPMTVWWHRSGIRHKDAIGQKGGRFFTVELRHKCLSLLNQYAETPEDFHEKSTQIVWLACRLYHEFKNWQTCSELIAEGITLEMLAHSIRKQNRNEPAPPPWLSRIVDKLNDEFLINHKTEELAAEADVHPVYLASVFRKFHHETIGEYVQKLRLDHAGRLLMNGDLRLADIACSAGFADQSHFTRAFKRATGITPGAFRKSLD